MYGGQTYWQELFANSFDKKRKLKELKTLNKVITLDNADSSKVDETEQALKLQTPVGFNDHHLLAIFIVSGCQLLCSSNNHDFPVIQDKHYYSKEQKPPKIYSGGQENLLQDKTIAKRCKPCKKAV